MCDDGCRIPARISIGSLLCVRAPGILRRKVIEAEKSAPEIAREAIEMMRALYVVEKHARDSSIAERLDLRRKQSAQVLVRLARIDAVRPPRALPTNNDSFDLTPRVSSLVR